MFSDQFDLIGLIYVCVCVCVRVCVCVCVSVEGTRLMYFMRSGRSAFQSNRDFIVLFVYQNFLMAGEGGGVQCYFQG